MHLTKTQESELLAMIRAGRGKVSPEAVVDAAKSPASSLHSLVGWDRSDDELAHRYRLERARLVLAALKLRDDEETQRQLSRVKSAPERERLASVLAQMEAVGARRTISYETGNTKRCYRDVVQELTNGNEARVLQQLRRELEIFVQSRACLHPEFFLWMQRVLADANNQWPEPQADA